LFFDSREESFKKKPEVKIEIKPTEEPVSTTKEDVVSVKVPEIQESR
jgi:hypothetical protein